MSQIREIWEGWKQWINREKLSDDQRRIIERRLESCLVCHHAKEHWISTVLNTFIDLATGRLKTNKQKQRNGFLCGICHCPLDQKTMTWMSECPLPEYNGEVYYDQQRWGRVRFEEGKLVTPEAIFITAPTSGFVETPPVQP